MAVPAVPEPPVKHPRDAPATRVTSSTRLQRNRTRLPSTAMVASSHRLSPSSQPELPLADGFRDPTHEQWQRQGEKNPRDSGRLAGDAPAPGEDRRASGRERG